MTEWLLEPVVPRFMFLLAFIGMFLVAIIAQWENGGDS